MSSSVEQIKSKIDIVSLVGSYIKLDKAGTNFKGKCPFHNEKTPSFFVSPDRGNYYCFGCQAKGDIFTFVQEFEGLDFVGSLKVLADKAGVSLQSFDRHNKAEATTVRLHSVLEQATFFYQKKLSENIAAKKYLESRGVTEETVKNFRLGFAPAEWRDLYEFLQSKNVPEKDMLEVGLVKQKDTGQSRPYDTFRGRIMFPISDSSGRVVGFSGRILVPDEKSPKYLNSPETSLFNKSEILFGLDLAKKDIRLKDYSILVEGQMDLVMLHQVGVSNTVASSGTALTAEHLVKLRRLSNRIIMAFDGDSAGFSASNRSAQIALSLGMELKIAQMPEGKDPADLAKEDPTLLKEILKTSKHIIDFYTDSLLLRGLDSRALGQEIKKNVLPYISILPSTIEKDHFIKSIAKKTFIKEESLWDDLKRLSGMPAGVALPEPSTSPPSSRVESIEKKIIGFLIWQKEKKDPLTAEAVATIEKRLEEIMSGISLSGVVPEHSGGNKLYKTIVTTEIEKEALLFETESRYNNENNAVDIQKDINELLLGLEEEYLKKERDEVRYNLQKAEQSGNELEIEKYKKEYHRISQRIDEIKNTNEKK